MADDKADPTLKATVANANLASPDQRSDPAILAYADDAPGDADPRDISTILMGAQATNGKAVISAGRMTVNADTADARRQMLSEQQKRNAQQTRELANLAAWNAKATTVGGVQMTNEQAQNDRQNVIDNDGVYADWAVRKGLISEDQKDDFKAGVRRKKDLEEKRGRGILTTAEATEAAQLDRSPVGRAIDAAAAQNHLDKGNVPQNTAEQARAVVSAHRQSIFRGRPPSRRHPT